MSGQQKPLSTGRAIRIGLIVSVVSVLVMLTPLLSGGPTGIKYLVAAAFIGACVGLCILLNALIDWARGK